MWFNIILLSIFSFTSSLTTSFDLGGVVNGDRMASVPLGISLGVGQFDVEGICSKPGMACQNCTSAVTCIRLPVGWLKLPLEECGKGLTCNAHLGQCSKQSVPECDITSQQYKHTCEQVGIFPDAYDCRKFHLCSPPQGLPDGRPADHRTALCPRHYGFNPKTAQCSVEMTNGQCKKKLVPDCSKVGDFGVLPSSDNHYYVCVMKQGVLYSQILICPHGWHFWDDGFCRPEARPNIENDSSKNGSNLKTIVALPVSIDSKSESNSNENSSEESSTKQQDHATEAPTTSRIDSFFSTEKATKYPADTFLADKFDLTNYETTDDVDQHNNDFVDSYENNDW